MLVSVCEGRRRWEEWCVEEEEGKRTKRLSFYVWVLLSIATPPSPPSFSLLFPSSLCLCPPFSLFPSSAFFLWTQIARLQTLRLVFRSTAFAAEFMAKNLQIYSSPMTPALKTESLFALSANGVSGVNGVRGDIGDTGVRASEELREGASDNADTGGEQEPSLEARGRVSVITDNNWPRDAPNPLSFAEPAVDIVKDVVNDTKEVVLETELRSDPTEDALSVLDN